MSGCVSSLTKVIIISRQCDFRFDLSLVLVLVLVFLLLFSFTFVLVFVNEFVILSRLTSFSFSCSLTKITLLAGR